MTSFPDAVILYHFRPPPLKSKMIQLPILYVTFRRPGAGHQMKRHRPLAMPLSASQQNPLTLNP